MTLSFIMPPSVPAALLAVFLLGALSTAAPEAHGQAPIALISHRSAQVDNLSLIELGRLYSGEATTFSPLCIHKGLSKPFFEAILGLSDTTVRKLWVRVLLSGKVSRGPIGFNSDEEVITYVRSHEGSLGFVLLDQVTADVKVLRINGLRPEHEAYPLRR